MALTMTVVDLQGVSWQAEARVRAAGQVDLTHSLTMGEVLDSLEIGDAREPELEGLEGEVVAALERVLGVRS